MAIFETFEKLNRVVSVSGSEKAISEIIRPMIEGFCDEIKSDALGNLIAHKKSKYPDAKKLMIAAHMDEIGFIVTQITEEGFLRVSAVGGVNITAAAYSEVTFESGLKGVLVPEGKVAPGDISAANMYVDIGADFHDDAFAYVSPGDVCTLSPRVAMLRHNTISASSLGGKIACAVLIETIRELGETSYPNDLYFVFTSGNEVGYRGARAAATGILPDYAISVDITGSGDTPECVPLTAKLGGGAAIKVMDKSVICHREMVNLLVKTAEDGEIKHQLEIFPQGGSDTSVMQTAGAGAISGALSIPVRYAHTGVEVCSLDDAEAVGKLLYRVVTSELC
ncbi:aminopeptidase [Clostridia bacterium]|nr:aminopeptidase [Clostridia bacterium]